MFCAFFSLLMLCGGLGVLVWLAWQRVSCHLKANPEAAKLVSKVIAEHLIPPLLVGGEPEETPEHKPQETGEIQTIE